MKVIFSPEQQNKVKFRDISFGHSFVFHNQLYIKIFDSKSNFYNNNKKLDNNHAVNLHNGHIAQFSPNVMVIEPFDAKVNVEGFPY